MKDIITFAQIGCGYWGPNLLRNIISNKKCKLKTVVDLELSRLDFVKGLYPSVNVTNDIQQVFNDTDIDAIVIATPVAAHFDLAIESLKAKKHILVEKPLAKTISEVEQIGELALINNLVAMVGHTFIYNAAVRYLKKLINSGDMGEVRYIYSQRLNLGRIRSDVDALWNLAPHDVSIIQYLLGDPEPISITRKGMDYIQKGIEDVVFLDIVYPNKIMAHIHVSWLDPNKTRRMTVVGSKKMVVYDDISDYKIAIYDKGIEPMARLGEKMDFDNPNILKFRHRSGDVILPMVDFIEPLNTEISHFIDCIENGFECLTGIEHALKVVKILSEQY